MLVVADVNDKDGSPQDTYRSMMTSVTEQLHNLQLPCVDVLRFTTVVRNTAPAKCEAAIRAFKQIKKQGKARYLAFSQHDPNIMLEWIERYEEIDIVYMPYNYFASKADQELFPLARKKDLGIVVIKPFNKGTIFDPRLAQLIKGSGSLSVLGRAEKEGEGRNPEDLTRGTGLTLAQASLRFILSRPEVSTVIPGMETVEEVRENLKAAHGAACGPAEKRLLAGYCGHCKNALPLDYRWLCDWRRA